MPRGPRRWEPWAIYHVDARAHDGAPIFGTDEDRAFVVRRAARVFAEEDVTCFAWAVLVNHYHLLLRCPEGPGHAIQRLNTAIARRVRIRSGGRGAVFQGRFFSAVCTDEAGVLTRLAYVTANPVHHGVVASIDALDGHPWSSLGEISGRRRAVLADRAQTLALLHPKPDLAQRSLLELLEIRLRIWAERSTDNASESDEDAAPEPSILLPRRAADETSAPRSLGGVAGNGRPAALDWEARSARREVLRAGAWTPDALIPAACRVAGASARHVRSGRRDPSACRARAIVACVACDHVGWPTDEVAVAVGVSSSAVSQARNRGREILEVSGIDAAALLAQSRSGGQG